MFTMYLLNFLMNYKKKALKCKNGCIINNANIKGWLGWEWQGNER